MFAAISVVCNFEMERYADLPNECQPSHVPCRLVYCRSVANNKKFLMLSGQKACHHRNHYVRSVVPFFSYDFRQILREWKQKSD